MNSRPLLIAVLATSLLLAGGAGAVAGDAPDADPSDGLGSDDPLSSSESAYAEGDAVDATTDGELPDTLPEAVGHALLLLGQLVEVVPPTLAETVIGIL